jgi:putative flippase GtrA
VNRLLTLARQQKPETKRFIKFLMVGAFGFAVDFGSFNLFHWLGVGPWVITHLIPGTFQTVTPDLMQHPEVVEQTFSFSAAVLSNFAWNYLWIYPEARNANQAKKMTKFIIVSVAGLLIGIPVFSAALTVAKALVTAVGLDNLAFNLAGNLALAGRVGVLLFWNFFVNRYWTYRDVGRG